VVKEDNRSDISSIKECYVKNSEMYKEILYPKGDPVVSVISTPLGISMCSIAESDNEISHHHRPESASHYYDSSSSRNSVQTHQQYDSGNPIVDNEVTVTNEGSAYNDSS